MMAHKEWHGKLCKYVHELLLEKAEISNRKQLITDHFQTKIQLVIQIQVICYVQETSENALMLCSEWYTM